MALIEAGWRLGDRVLLLAAPQLRGDDVVSLQQALNHLGFDCGRPDGILGPATIRALVDFQRNSGINPDGVCGPITVSKLELLRRQSGSGPGVARIRESESVIGSSTFGSLRVVVGQFGGLSAITRTLSRSLRQAGAIVLSTDEYEASAHASVANRFGASIYIGFEAQSEPCSTISYFAVPEFESRGGRALARQLTLQFDEVLTPHRPRWGCGCRCSGRLACRPCCARSAPSARWSTPPNRSPKPWSAPCSRGRPTWPNEGTQPHGRGFVHSLLHRLCVCLYVTLKQISRDVGHAPPNVT